MEVDYSVIIEEIYSGATTPQQILIVSRYPDITANKTQTTQESALIVENRMVRTSGLVIGAISNQLLLCENMLLIINIVTQLEL